MRKQTFATLVICLAFVYSAEAANLASSAPSDGKTVVTLSGEVAQGDADVLGKLLKAGNDRGHRVAGIRLNSTGGNLLEGIMLGRLVSEGKIATIVDEGAKCTAACFVVFVAGSPKYVHERAAVGVHGAAETSGEETMPSRSAALSTAEIVKEFGVPAGIIEKLVVTPRQQVVWLSPDELRLMGLKGSEHALQVRRLTDCRLHSRAHDLPKRSHRLGSNCLMWLWALQRNRTTEIRAITVVVIGRRKLAGRVYGSRIKPVT
jgi:hypothetical protein